MSSTENRIQITDTYHSQIKLKMHLAYCEVMQNFSDNCSAVALCRILLLPGDAQENISDSTNDQYEMPKSYFMITQLGDPEKKLYLF